ncbi:unnamed protein product, partial [Arctia plantaginis]
VYTTFIKLIQLNVEIEQKNVLKMSLQEFLVEKFKVVKQKKKYDNLAPRHPHKFRLKVIVQTEAVPTLADRAVLFYGSEEAVYEKLSGLNDKDQNSDSDNKILYQI